MVLQLRKRKYYKFIIHTTNGHAVKLFVKQFSPLQTQLKCQKQDQSSIRTDKTFRLVVYFCDVVSKFFSLFCQQLEL